MSSTKKYEIVPKSKNYGDWYKTVLSQADMIDYSDVSGCYVLKPLSNDIWENIKQYLNAEIIKLDIQNYYFPMFATNSNLEKESKHFDDFIPEVAWIVTTDPKMESKMNNDPEINELISKLKAKGLNVNVRTENSVRYAIRPTSETIIYPHFADWLKSTGKYPKINQWANIVRWENKTTQPFIRSREFLWQEGHTCHPTKEEALKEVYTIVDIYKNFYENILAVPMIAGVKTKSETFPGAELTATLEGFLPDSGKGIQSATSHYLGEKFAKIFNIKNLAGEYIHQNSWGVTTRSIGIMIMTHSDDRGLILPPKIAPIQIVIIACGLNTKTKEEIKKQVNATLHDFTAMLNNNNNNIRAVFDHELLNESPGMKFNKWEVKGVPLRIEFGPTDMKNNTITFVRRDKPPRTKEQFKFSDIRDNPAFINEYLNNIQFEMFQKALADIIHNIVYCPNNINGNINDNINDNINNINNIYDVNGINRSPMINALKNKKLVLLDLYDDEKDECDINQEKEEQFENELKELCKKNNINSTKILCIPSKDILQRIGFDGDINKKMALFGRSY